MQIYIIILKTIAKYSDISSLSIMGPIMTDKMNKTEKFINILYTVTSTPGRKIGHQKLIELLGNPSKAQKHKLINELVQGAGSMEPLLNVSDDPKPEDRIYKLNSKVWDNFVTAETEGYFFLEAFKRLGKIISCDYTKMNFEDAFEFEGRKVVDLDRKFMYLSKIEAKVTPKYEHMINELVKGLLENRQMKITYSAANINGISERIIEPLTLCQYRDDLYIMCYKVDEDVRFLRNYKVSRIEDVVLLKETFSYPSMAKWNPEEIYKDASGLILGTPQKATIRVYNESRLVFREKNFFNNFLIKEDNNFDQYQVCFTNTNEFIGQLFVYAQDIEILAPSEIREKFIEKAKSALTKHGVEVEDEAA